MRRIPYTRPSITEKEVGYATDAARNGWGDDCYAYIERFEAMFCDYLGVKYAIATSSCTGAYHLGLAASGIQNGDEVLLADINWIATVSPIVHLNATPVFTDILSHSWCIDPEEVASGISSRTKAVIATHLYGNLCDMSNLRRVTEEAGVLLIEDSAEAIGSTYHGQLAGSFGDFSVFSFHGTKTVTTGEGGMFVTNNENLYQKALTLSNHGREKQEERQFWPSTLGYKFKMSNVQAAIGCAQMERVSELVARKREVLNKYRSFLGHQTKICLNYESAVEVPGAWMPTVVFADDVQISQDEIIAAFKLEDIDARVFFHPLTSLPMFGSKAINPTSSRISSKGVNLPSFHDITDEQIERVSNVITGLLEKYID